MAQRAWRKTAPSAQWCLLKKVHSGDSDWCNRHLPHVGTGARPHSRPVVDPVPALLGKFPRKNPLFQEVCSHLDGARGPSLSLRGTVSASKGEAPEPVAFHAFMTWQTPSSMVPLTRSSVNAENQHVFSDCLY